MILIFEQQLIHTISATLITEFAHTATATAVGLPTITNMCTSRNSEHSNIN